jgi:hypothetical protein
VSRSDKLISGALREIAEQAVAPPPMADAAWQSGRRRRLRVTAVSLAGAAGVVAAALLVPLAMAHGPTHIGHPASSAGRIRPHSPLQFRQVAGISSTPCKAGSGGLPGSLSPACFHLAGAGMTITRVRSAQLTEPKPGDYVIFISLAPADRHRFAALSEELVGLPAPHDQIAIVVGGQVIAHPAVTGVATSGFVQISGITSRSRAVTLIRDLRAG